MAEWNKAYGHLEMPGAMAKPLFRSLQAKPACRPRWLGAVPCQAAGIGHVIPALSLYGLRIIKVWLDRSRDDMPLRNADLCA